MKISIHPTCAFEATRFHIRIKATTSATERFEAELQKSVYGRARIDGEAIDIHFEHETGEDVYGTWRNINFGIKHHTEGTIVDLSCAKVPEGDDALDQHAFDDRMIGKLPDNFWLEPAAFIKKFMDL